jgi:crotonobetainyl-CoA:carnitine CoA-transferase CaiB-like acyl-CoA transferase
MRHLPLQGTRVLDLSRVLAGPLCTMLLGDLGADVIKVERPGSGDDTRTWGPPFDARGESAYYLSTNRNKLSVAADLHSDRDRDFVLKLMTEADVVVENFLPGTLEAFGIHRDLEMRRDPKLVWCTITGFGLGSNRPGYDFVVQAESGWMAITGDPGGDPVKTGVALGDVIAGKDATIAILAALAGRASSGKGGHVAISLIDSARAALVNVAQNALVSGAAPRRYGNAHANLVPYQLFETKDRPMVIAVGTDAQWGKCMVALGRPDLASDRTLSTNPGRLAQRDRVVAEIARALRGRTAAEWLEDLSAVGVPCGVVKGVLEAITEAGSASALYGMPSPVSGQTRVPPPKLDEHGAQIRDLGWGVFSGYRGGAASS